MRNSRKTNPKSKLKLDLNLLLVEHDFNSFLKADPIQFPRRFKSQQNQEIVGLFSALLAYGRVSAIRKAISSWLDLCHHDPLECILNDSADEALRRYEGWSYRFTQSKDLAKLSIGLKKIYTHYTTLGDAFHYWDQDQSPNLIPVLQQFYTYVHEASDEIEGGRSFAHFLSSPYQKSALKRLNLFLRWMVRGPDDVDLGIWNRLGTHRLLMPVDVHVFRLSKALGWTQRKSVSLATVLEITDQVKKLNAQDPTQYDFALAHLGISRSCKGKYSRPICTQCSLFEQCTLRLIKTVD